MCIRSKREAGIFDLQASHQWLVDRTDDADVEAIRFVPRLPSVCPGGLWPSKTDYKLGTLVVSRCQMRRAPDVALVVIAFGEIPGLLGGVFATRPEGHGQVAILGDIEDLDSPCIGIKGVCDGSKTRHGEKLILCLFLFRCECEGDVSLSGVNPGCAIYLSVSACGFMLQVMIYYHIPSGPSGYSDWQC